jgi:hypothetical protein
MKRETTYKVKTEALRVLAAIDAIERCTGLVNYSCQNGNPHKDDVWVSGQYVASAKRASMDLTRALADMRRG